MLTIVLGVGVLTEKADRHTVVKHIARLSVNLDFSVEIGRASCRERVLLMV